VRGSERGRDRGWKIALHGLVVAVAVVTAAGGGFWVRELPVQRPGGTDQIADVAMLGAFAQFPASEPLVPLTSVSTDVLAGYLATGGLAVTPDVLPIATYVTSEGETIYEVARTTGRSPETLLWANNLVDPGRPLPAGIQLRIPPVNGMLHVVREGDTLESIAARYQVDVSAITGYAPNGVQYSTDLVPYRLLMVPGGTMPSRDRVILYTVQEGDTLWRIAQRFGLQTKTITLANSLPDPELIHPGQHLAILPTDGVMVQVKEGDTVESLAEYWGVDPQVIRDYPMNGLGENGVLRVGQYVMIPGGEPPPPPPPPAPPPSPAGSAAAARAPAAQRQAPSGSFIWPTTGVITQYFHRSHNGWDIANRMYTEIWAADSGTVIFSGWNDYGLGYAVAIDHGNGFVTWYGHMAEPPPVRVGQWVNQGQYIGPMGSTGYSTGPHVHFVIVYNGVYQDPAWYLN
jgi:murein DD-endopeptidase MepM/ murein hydrolase activator NlpD